MTIVLGIDLGTTKTTAIAVQATTGEIIANATSATVSNQARPDDRARGRFEFDASELIAGGIGCLRDCAGQLCDRVREVVGIGVTGQQHGTVVVDSQLRPLTPFINWQDQRGNDRASDQQSWVVQAIARMDAETQRRTGCRLRTGFLATTLFWMAAQQCRPANGTACFLMDLFVATLTGERLMTDPSCAGSAGVFDVPSRQWSRAALEALGISGTALPEVREANQSAGGLKSEFADAVGLPRGVPVFVPIGDHQASFLGTVADRMQSVLLNVGTGAQVAVFTPGSEYVSPIELRPFPISGNLLSCVGLCGGWQFQVLEQFFRQVGEQVFGVSTDGTLFGALTRLSQTAAPGASGLSCVPTFSGTRANPQQRGTVAGISASNLTPANLVRALLEGMAQDYRQAYDLICSVTQESKSRLMTAGNGLRENRVLASLVRDCFELSPEVTRHREEAAFGAALIATVGAGVHADLMAAGQLVQTGCGALGVDLQDSPSA